MVAGLAARLAGLTAGSLQLDESFTVILAENSLERIFRLAPTDANPPLTSLVYKLWTNVFGTSELSWELPAALVGTATIGILGLLAARLFGRETGVVSAWLLASSPLHISFSQQVRSYSLAIVLSMLAAWALTEDLRQPRASRAVVFLGAGWLFLNTHYYAFLIVPAFFAGAFVARLGDFASLRRLGGQAVVLSVLTLPTAICLYLQYTEYYSFDWIERPRSDFVIAALDALGGGSTLAVCLFAAAVAAGLHATFGRDRPATGVLSAWLALPTILAFVASVLGRAFLHPRYVVLWLIPFLVLAACGIVRLPRGWHRFVAVALLCGLGIPEIVEADGNHALSRVEKQSYRFIEEHYRDGDVVLHLTKRSYVPALFYHGHRLEEFFLAGTPSSNVMKYWMPYQTATGIGELARYRRLWLYRKPSLPPAAVETIVGLSAFRDLRARPVYGDDLGTLFLFELEAADR